MPAMTGMAALRRSPRLKISNADAWSLVVLKPHTWQTCFLSPSFLGTGLPHGHGCDVPRASTFTSCLPALSALQDNLRRKDEHRVGQDLECDDFRQIFVSHLS